MSLNKQRFNPTQEQKIILRDIDKKVKQIWKNSIKLNDFISFIRMQKPSSWRDFVIKRINRLVKLFTDEIGRKRKVKKAYRVTKSTVKKIADKVITRNYESTVLFYRNTQMQGV